MSAAVDNELAKSESQSFYEHIEICGSCRDEFELERLTKAYIKRKITFVDVPYDLETAIMAQISNQGGTAIPSGFLDRVVSNSIFQPVLAVGVVFVLAIILFFANKDNIVLPPSPGDQLATSVAASLDGLTIAGNNFQDVLSGKFKPEITAIATADVASFILKNAGYTLDLPGVQSADWIGGSVSSQGRHKMAHVIYKMGENYIYLYCFPKDAMISQNVHLPAKCMDTIDKNDWFWTQDEDGDVQAVWNFQNNVCIATANLDKKDLVAYLQPGTGAKNP